MSALSRRGTQVLAMFTVLVVLVLCCEARAQVYDGSWKGTTSQGTLVTFTVVNDAITFYGYGFNIGPCINVVSFDAATRSNPIPIINGLFIAGAGSLAGTFSSSVAASGTINNGINNPNRPACSGSVSLTWTATNTPPLPPPSP